MATIDATHEAVRMVTLQRHALSTSSSTAREVIVKTMSKEESFNEQ